MRVGSNKLVELKKKKEKKLPRTSKYLLSLSSTLLVYLSIFLNKDTSFSKRNISATFQDITVVVVQSLSHIQLFGTP